MDISKFLKQQTSPPDPVDEVLYACVATELKDSVLKEGLWTKALADNGWDEQRAKADYVNMRVAQLREELQAQGAYQQKLLENPEIRARAGGLTDEEIEYLGNPLEADRYTREYGISKKKLEKAIKLGHIRAVVCRGVLWVRNERIA